MKTQKNAHRLALCSALMLALACGAAHAGRVVIIEGSDPDADMNNAIHQIATVAQINYLAKGYTVERLSNVPMPVSKADALQALNSPQNNALVFVGHGTKSPPPPPGGGPFTPGLVLNNGPMGVLTPADISAANAARIRHVEFQACGQKLSAWDSKFSNAGGIDAWGQSVTVGQAYNDALNGSPDRIPPKNPPARPGAGVDPQSPDERGAPPPKTTDPRFVAAIRATPSHMMPPGSFDRLFNRWTELGFSLPPSVAVQFGPRTFNIQTLGPFGPLVLKGLMVNGGTVVGELTGGYAVAEFTLEVDATAFASIMANIDTLPSAQAGGLVRVVGNTTPLPDNVLIAGAAGAYFGMFSLRPPCPADLNFDWVGNTADLVLFLGNFGTAVAPFTNGDFDGNGVVNVADLTIFLGSFGCG